MIRANRSFCIGCVLAGAAALALSLPLRAEEPKSITLKANYAVGQKYTLVRDDSMKGQLTITMEGEVEKVPMFNHEQHEIEVEVTAVEEGYIRGETVGIKKLVRRGTEPGMEEPMVLLDARSGTVTVQRDARGVVTTSKAGEGLAEDVAAAVIQMGVCRPDELQVPSPVAVGASWPLKSATFMGNEGTISGEAKLIRIEGEGEARQAVIEVSTGIGEAKRNEEADMSAMLQGTVVFDIATGRCLSVTLAGPMEMKASPMGIDMQGKGDLSVSSRWDWN